MLNYVSSSHFDRPTIFAGHDVLFLRSLPEFSDHIVTNYRYHPSQPYCSDFLFVQNPASASALLKDVFDAQRWMPRQILDGAADQLAYTITRGMPEKHQFNGASFYTPRRRDVLAVPASEYLFTPNDSFPSRYEQFGSMTDSPDYSELMVDKIALHFKGNRKTEFFNFAEWAWHRGYVDLTFKRLGSHSIDWPF